MTPLPVLTVARRACRRRSGFAIILDFVKVPVFRRLGIT